MELLIPQLTLRPGEQARVRRAKQALKAKMEPELSNLLLWARGGYLGFQLLPAALQQQAPAATQTWTTGALYST